MPESDVNWSTLIPLKSETTSSSEKSNEKKNSNDAVSLQEAFLKKNQDFIAKSKLRVQKVKDIADINVHKKKTTSKKLSERKPAVKKKNVAIKLDKGWKLSRNLKFCISCNIWSNACVIVLLPQSPNRQMTSNILLFAVLRKRHKTSIKYATHTHISAFIDFPYPI